MARSPLNILICDNIVAYMKREGCYTLMWGDGALCDIAGASGVSETHPLNKIDRSIRALEGDKRFTKMRIHGMDSRGRSRIVRGFNLLEEYR
jgi:hypothetical protein